MKLSIERKTPTYPTESLTEQLLRIKIIFQRSHQRQIISLSRTLFLGSTWGLQVHVHFFENATEQHHVWCSSRMHWTKNCTLHRGIAIVQLNEDPSSNKASLQTYRLQTTWGKKAHIPSPSNLASHSNGSGVLYAWHLHQICRSMSAVYINGETKWEKTSAHIPCAKDVENSPPIWQKCCQNEFTDFCR